MRKWRFTRPVRSGRSMVLLALGITVLVHAGFLLYGYRTAPASGSSGGNGIQMLNISSMPEKQRKDLMNWIALHDPAGTAKSTSRSGYSCLYQPQKWFSTDIHPFRTRETGFDFKVSDFYPVPVVKRKAPAAPGFPEKFTAPEKARVTALDKNGRVLKGFLKSVPAYSGYAAPAVIRVVRFGKVCNVSIVSSSGKRELDLAACAAASGLEVADQEIITVIWPQGENRK